MLVRVLPGVQRLRVWPLPPVWRWLVPRLKRHSGLWGSSALRTPSSCNEGLPGSGAPAPGEAPGFCRVPSCGAELPALPRCPHSVALSGLHSERKKQTKYVFGSFNESEHLRRRILRNPDPTSARQPLLLVSPSACSGPEEGSAESGACGPGAALALLRSVPVPGEHGHAGRRLRPHRLCWKGLSAFEAARSSVPGWIRGLGRGIEQLEGSPSSPSRSPAAPGVSASFAGDPASPGWGAAGVSGAV